MIPMSGTQNSNPKGGRPASGEPVLDRAFRVLQAFADGGSRRLSLTALSSRSGLPKTTAHRLAAQLVALGALEKLEDGTFVIGLRLLEIASLGPRGYGLRAAALPYLEDLHKVTRQHVLLAVREGDEAVLIERLSSHDATTVKYRVGGRLPLDTTGVGIALLAHAPLELRNRVIALSEGEGRNPNIRNLIAMVHLEGVCVVTGPNPAASEPAIMSTAASPIMGPRGTLLGAVSVVAPDGALAANRVALRTTSLAIARMATMEPSRARAVERPPGPSR
jgi:DNA-binding IclR family transcriptional regulator